MADRNWRPPGSLRDRAFDAMVAGVVIVVLLLFLIGVVDGLITVVNWLR